jgi:hypothetical protein
MIGFRDDTITVWVTVGRNPRISLVQFRERVFLRVLYFLPRLISLSEGWSRWLGAGTGISSVQLVLVVCR